MTKKNKHGNRCSDSEQPRSQGLFPGFGKAREKALGTRLDSEAPQEEFKHGGVTLKTHQMFSVHTTLEEFENKTIIGHFGLVLEENWGREIT